ncbi:MAG: YceI family protein [Thermoleophilia bacterium]|nr:YceI family protein [Thermoleophilia bacterium]
MQQTSSTVAEADSCVRNFQMQTHFHMIQEQHHMTTATATKISTGTWTLDPVHSSVAFRVHHFGLTWLRGGFEDFSLTATVDETGAVQLEGSTQVETINFTNPQLKGHLLSPDFFDAQLYPTLTFSSTNVELADDGSATVVADLTLKGTTKSVILTGTWAPPTEGLGGDTRFGLELSGAIDRNDFGISWAAQLANGADVVAPKVKLEGQFELVKS